MGFIQTKATNFNVALLLLILGTSAQAAVDVTFTLPQQDLQAREVFEVPIYLTDDAIDVASYALRIVYSSNLVKIIDINGGNTPAFSINPTTDRSTFNSGITDFTANNQGFLATPSMYEVARVRFEVIGFPGAQGSIGIELSPHGGIVNDTDFNLEASVLPIAGNIIIDDQGRINEAPVANAGADQSILVGETASMSGEGSHDPDNYPAPVSYVWSILDTPSGSTITSTDIVNADQAIVQLTPDIPGIYTLEISVSDGVDTSVDETIISVIDNNLPDKPTGLTGEAKRRHIKLQWNNSDKATNYIIYRRTDTETDFSVRDETDDTDHKDRVPKNSQSIEYYIVATNDYGNSTPSAIIQIDKENRKEDHENLPDTPTDVTGKTKGRHVKLNWDDSEHANSYVIYRRLESETEFTVLKETEETSYKDKIRKHVHSVEYYVVAKNENGVSAASEVIELVTTK